MHSKNSNGLACGSNYSCGCNDAPVNPTPSSSCGCSSNLGILYPPAAPAVSKSSNGNRFNNFLAPVRAGAPMTFQPQMAVPVEFSFREGLAFGAAWAASLELGRMIPAQWSVFLENTAQSYGTPVSASGEPWSNRSAFVSGFLIGALSRLGSRSSLTAPNGRTYTRDFLRAQGTFAANTMFDQVRPAILPAIAGPTGMSPMTPGVVRMSTYERFVYLARTAPYGVSVPGWNNTDPASVWVRFLMGNAIPPFPTPPEASLNETILSRVRNWALALLAEQMLGRTYPIPTLEHVRAIASTPWIPICAPGEPRNPDGSCLRLR